MLHDRALPYGRANVDHLVIGPTGVYVIDSKKWHRNTTISGRSGKLWIGRYPADQVLRGLVYETRAVSEALHRSSGQRVDVVAVVTVHGARMPRWGKPINVDGIIMLRASRLCGWILRRPRIHQSDQFVRLAAAATKTFPPYT